MTAARPLLLDNEAVQALLDRDHRRHRRVVLLVEVTAASGRRRGRPAPVVPNAVRVEAAKVDGSWKLLDAVEDLLVPDDLAQVERTPRPRTG